MFDYLKRFGTIIVTGPHRSGTTIAAEMIARDLDLRCWREEEFDNRDVVKAEQIVRAGGVIQGPYLLPWTPFLSEWPATAVVFMRRNYADVDRSNQRLRARKISRPFFDHGQADRLWSRIRPLIENAFEIEYETLADHPLWVHDRKGWLHRQTRPGQGIGR